jgi:hypothetical protein
MSLNSRRRRDCDLSLAAQMILSLALKRSNLEKMKV